MKTVFMHAKFYDIKFEYVWFHSKFNVTYTVGIMIESRLPQSIQQIGKLLG